MASLQHTARMCMFQLATHGVDEVPPEALFSGMSIPLLFHMPCNLLMGRSTEMATADADGGDR